MTHKLAGHPVQFWLPVKLSDNARREALLSSGQQPDPIQYFDIENLSSVDAAKRERVLEVSERIAIAEKPGPGPRVTRYDSLRHTDGGGWRLAEPDGLVIPAEEVFFPGPGLTRMLYGLLQEEQQDPARLEAMWSYAPLVDDLGHQAELSLDAVLEAYGRAFGIAQRAEELALEGRRDECPWLTPAISLADDLLILKRDSDYEDAITIGLVRDSDPEAFRQAVDLTREVREAKNGELERRFANDACGSAFAFGQEIESDGDVVTYAIAPAADRVRDETRQAAARTAYDHERERWIADRGSQRLKLAAARGYRHDGMYRDERLAQDLPGFISSLGRNPGIREAINPSQEALELETSVLERIAKGDLGELEARLVWVQDTGFDGVPSGEYVEVKPYLGRHSVYKPADPDRERDDIPF
jgi:hypothetical protein